MPEQRSPEHLTKLLEFWNTPAQIKAIEAIREHGNMNQASIATGCHPTGLLRHVQRAEFAAAKRGYAPEHDATKAVPQGQQLKGLSTLYDRTGAIAQQWVKSMPDVDRQREMMEQAARALAEDLPQVRAVKPPTNRLDHLMNVYPMGDPHFGMYSWAAETGNDFDLNIAESQVYAALDYLIKQSPNAKRGVLVNLGDYFHAENMAGVTTRSGNVLDMDTRFDRMIDIGYRSMRFCIERLLKKHEQVEVINAPGNHDETMAKFMSIALKHQYEKEPRLKVHSEPTPRYYIEHGRVLVGVVHGDKTKDSELPGIMATEKSEAWGRTKHRYYYRGHHHHDTRHEYNGCIVEQMRTLAPGDAYAVGHGYLSGQDMKCIVHHKQFGEIARFTCGIDIIRAA